MLLNVRYRGRKALTAGSGVSKLWSGVEVWMIWSVLIGWSSFFFDKALDSSRVRVAFWLLGYLQRGRKGKEESKDRSVAVLCCSCGWLSAVTGAYIIHWLFFFVAV